MISESWSPIDSETPKNRNCNARLRTHKGDSARIGFVIQRLQREAIDESGSFLAFGAAVRTD
jgi:hypothetical protein